jgi:serine/threonine protein phosphatase PrpC
VAASDRGLVRPDNQDAFAVSPGPPLRVGVFDGVGGLEHGGKAARAAAARLPSCGPHLLSELDAVVRTTGGVTTAAVAEIANGSARITWMGDSRVYRLAEDVRPLGPAHALPDGRLTQALGLGGPGQIVTVPLDAPLLLCTDGVPRRAILFPAEDLKPWAAQLVERIHRLGAPDNLTFVAVRRARGRDNARGRHV